MDREKAGVELLYVVHIVAKKKDHTLVWSLMTALLKSPGFLHQTLMEYCLAPILSSDNGLAECAKFLKMLEKHKDVQERLCHWFFQSWRVLTFMLRCWWNKKQSQWMIQLWQ
jgi:hypothetical protein